MPLLLFTEKTPITLQSHTVYYHKWDSFDSFYTPQPLLLKASLNLLSRWGDWMLSQSQIAGHDGSLSLLLRRHRIERNLSSHNNQTLLEDTIFLHQTSHPRDMFWSENSVSRHEWRRHLPLPAACQTSDHSWHRAGRVSARTTPMLLPCGTAGTHRKESTR